MSARKKGSEFILCMRVASAARVFAFALAIALVGSLLYAGGVSLGGGTGANGDSEVYAADSVNMRVHGIFLGNRADRDSEEVVGEATLVESNGKFLLIDTGANTALPYLMSYLKKVGVREMDVLISHMHNDHVGGLDDLLGPLSDIRIRNVYLPDKSLTPEYPRKGVYDKVAKAIKQHDIVAGWTTKEAISRYDTVSAESATETTRASFMVSAGAFGMASYAAVYIPTIEKTGSVVDVSKYKSVTYEWDKTRYDVITASAYSAEDLEGGGFAVVLSDTSKTTVITEQDIARVITRTAITNIVPNKPILKATIGTHYIKRGDSFKVGKANVNVIGPVGKYEVNDFKYEDGYIGSKEGHYLNNSSLSLMIKAGKKKFFTGGDIEKEEEAALLRKYSKSYLNADLMKLSHHGLKTSNTSKFLKDISPTFSFAGNSGSQGYIGASRLRYLLAHNSRVNASRYGMVYLIGDESRNIIYDVSDKRITVREGSVKSKPLNGWVTVKGGYSQYWKTDKYYIDSLTGKPVKGNLLKGGKRYYMGSGGCMEKAYYAAGGKYLHWRSYNGVKNVRYYSKNGQYYNGVKKIGRHTYLFSSKGYRKTGIEKVKGKFYYFDRAGKMAKNKTVKIAGHKLKASKSGAIRGSIPGKIKAMAGK